MDYLYFLQQLRQAAPTWVNEAILFGSEFVAGLGGLALMSLVYWCISKRAGAFLMMNYGFAYVCNTVIKNILCVERPFLRDPRLTPYVPATGYSFPSGHTMLATGVYGGLALWQRKRTWFAALCVFLAFFTAFTRNWLGAHTIEDVAVGILCSAGVIALNAFLLKWVEEKPGRDILLFAVSAVVFAVFCLLYPTGLKPAGIYGGVMLGWILERQFIRFEISESIPFRVMTYVPGILVVGVLYKVILPMVFASFEKNVASMMVQFVTFLMITAGWPLVIMLLSRKPGKVSASQ